MITIILKEDEERFLSILKEFLRMEPEAVVSAALRRLAASLITSLNDDENVETLFTEGE